MNNIFYYIGSVKAAIIRKHGGPEESEITRLDPLVCRPNEVLVSVYASSVNPADWKARKGIRKLRKGRRKPKILGSDFSGVVVRSKGPDFEPGHEVFGMVLPQKGGAYAELLAVKDDNLALKPENLDFTQAGVVPLVGLTGLQALYRIADIQEGQSVLINGCTGGVGSVAVKIAQFAGANITGICSTRNVTFARALGIHAVIDYEKGAVYEKGKYDIIFDTIGNLRFSKAKKDLNPKGVFVTTVKSRANFWAHLLNSKCKRVKVKPKAEDLDLLRDIIEEGNIIPIRRSHLPPRRPRTSLYALRIRQGQWENFGLD